VVVSVAVIALITLAVTNTHSHPSASSSSTSPSPTASLPAIGSPSPNGSFTTLAGTTESVASFKGKPTLLWFVSTWCSSCQASTKVMASNLATLARSGVQVKEIELYDDLGSPGPPMSTFAKVGAGKEFNNPDWTFGVSSLHLSEAYDPVGYLDVYYLINSSGKITYLNSSPSATMPDLLRAVKEL
jgi:thiol-disulfide isomerase/thioredoxin